MELIGCVCDAPLCASLTTTAIAIIFEFLNGIIGFNFDLFAVLAATTATLIECEIKGVVPPCTINFNMFLDLVLKEKKLNQVLYNYYYYYTYYLCCCSSNSNRINL